MNKMMNKRKTINLFLSVLIFFGTGLAHGAGLGEKAPDFTGKTLGGKNVKLSELGAISSCSIFGGRGAPHAKRSFPTSTGFTGNTRGWDSRSWP